MNRLLFSLAPLVLSAAAASHASDLALPPFTAQQRALYDLPSESPEVTFVHLVDDIDVWERIRRGFAIPDLENPLVGSQTNWYSSRPDYIQRTTLRASRYLYHVVEELEKRKMPMELALLPFIESAFEPQAVSSAKAVGMWQFMPATGADFKLNQSLFKDDRRDVLASTEAALTYLQRLHGLFGDWQLALAAYNWGEGSVQRAINKNRAAGLPIDFNSLSHLMPLETRNYYPKLQAVKNIIGTPEAYSIVLPRVENQPYFVQVGKTRDMDITIAAELAELSVAEFKALNPQFNRPVITGSPSDTQILLPQSNADKFKANLANWRRSLSSWTSHTVGAARERIETIAAKFGTTPQVIREVNNIPPNMRLRAGSTILVPKAAHSPERDIAADLVERAQMRIEPDRPDFRKVIIRAGKNDSLTSIANRNRVSVADIRGWNNLKQDKLSTGQRLELQLPLLARRAVVRPVVSAVKRPPARPVRRAAVVATKTKPVVALKKAAARS